MVYLYWMTGSWIGLARYGIGKDDEPQSHSPLLGHVPQLLYFTIINRIYVVVGYYAIRHFSGVHPGNIQGISNCIRYLTYSSSLFSFCIPSHFYHTSVIARHFHTESESFRSGQGIEITITILPNWPAMFFFLSSHLLFDCK